MSSWGCGAAEAQRPQHRDDCGGIGAIGPDEIAHHLRWRGLAKVSARTLDGVPQGARKLSESRLLVFADSHWINSTAHIVPPYLG